MPKPGPPQQIHQLGARALRATDDGPTSSRFTDTPPDEGTPGNGIISAAAPSAHRRTPRAQEARFAQAFADGDMSVTRDLYQPDVVYVSPTVRLFDWPSRIDGVDRTLEFIALTIRACAAFNYEAVEHAIAPRADAAFVRGRFGRIARQELYYDPSAALERLGSVTVARDGPSCRLPS